MSFPAIGNAHPGIARTVRLDPLDQLSIWLNWSATINFCLIVHQWEPEAPNGLPVGARRSILMGICPYIAFNHFSSAAGVLGFGAQGEYEQGVNSSAGWTMAGGVGLKSGM